MVRQLRALASNPLDMSSDEQVRLAPGTTARDRHTEPAVVIDANDIPARSATPHIVGREVRPEVERRGVLERQPKLHDHEDTPARKL